MNGMAAIVGEGISGDSRSGRVVSAGDNEASISVVGEDRVGDLQVGGARPLILEDDTIAAIVLDGGVIERETDILGRV